MSKKHKAHRYGLAAEKIAAFYLRCKGYRIVAERYRNRYGEIDLLAFKERTLVAVEVKARRSLKACEDAVPPWKRRKIERAMQGVLAGQGSNRGNIIAGLAKGGHPDIRFDVVWIAPWQWPLHIRDAWRVECER